MTNPTDSLSDEDRANLVAYFDGELDDAAAEALEKKLGLDPQARREADALQRTWDLLDYLPRPQPSGNFTSRTLERISDDRLARKSARRLLRAPWFLVLAWLTAFLAAGLVGFVAGSALAGWIGPSIQNTR